MEIFPPPPPPPTLPAPHLFYLHLSIPKMPESHPGSPRIPSRIVQDRRGLVFLLHALGFHPTPVSGSFRIVQDRSGFFRDPPAIALIMRVGVDRQDSLKTLGGFLEDSWRILGGFFRAEGSPGFFLLWLLRWWKDPLRQRCHRR